MSLNVFAVVLIAAAIHATWNAIVKGAGDKLVTAILIAGCAGIIGAIVLPFLPQPAPASWPFIVASAVLQAGYYVLLANAYRAGDMSRMYPMMRGTAPLIVTVVSVFFLHETVTLPGWTGVALISLGIFSLTLSGARGPSGMGGTGFALANAVVIAGYTLIDGAGVRASASPAGYTMWLFVLTALPLVAWALVYRRGAFVALIRSKLHFGLIGALGTLISYGLALWAMTLAPIPLVAALRETSILFGTAIAAFILREQVTPVRLAAVALVAGGAIILRLA